MTSTRVPPLPRTSLAIADALAQISSSGREQFESELRTALTHAASTLDLGPVDGVMDRWWLIAVARTQVLTDEEARQVARAHAGDFSGLQEQLPDGTFRRLA